MPIGRTLVAILEQGQQADGSVRIPEALVPVRRVRRPRAGLIRRHGRGCSHAGSGCRAGPAAARGIGSPRVGSAAARGARVIRPVRAFVALVPPAAVLAELAAAPSRRCAQPTPDLRWTPAAQWHLTLAFLGEIDGDHHEGVLPDLTERLARAARRHPPEALALSGAGRFGDRVLWTRVTGGRLRALAASVGAAARRCGIAVEDRPYRPHLTLARGRPGADLRPAVEALRGFAGTTWTADDAAPRPQHGWAPGPGGTAAHEVIATWPLGRAPPRQNAQLAGRNAYRDRNAQLAAVGRPRTAGGSGCRRSPPPATSPGRVVDDPLLDDRARGVAVHLLVERGDPRHVRRRHRRPRPRLVPPPLASST